jgi:CRP/FNR family transcriptional regulator, dissimilatory nitrate respiration regulator
MKTEAQFCCYDNRKDKFMDAQAAFTLGKSPLFFGLTQEEIQTMASCLDFHFATYDKDTFIQRRGDLINTVGVVLRGSVHIIAEDYWGNRNILGIAGVGQTFSESLACTNSAASPVDVIAETSTEIIFLDVRRVLTVCSSTCTFHARLIRNLLNVIAYKNLALTEKIMHVTKRTVREKILSYLSTESQIRGNTSFDIPFDRQQLADYLSAERSALSKNLCKLRDEGVITFKKNHFELL